MAGRSFADAARSATGADTAADKADSPKPIYRRVEVRDSPQQHKDAEPAVQRRAPSPSQQPRTGQEDEEKYILTLLTSHDLHKRMTEIRNKYFPKKLNKLAAHLTLFHALPGSRLESDIIPHIQSITSTTSPFPISATEIFRLSKGVAIGVPDSSGGSEAKRIHARLQAPWHRDGWLSPQDAGRAGGKFPHYTVMNKTDDEAEIQKALEELNGFRDSGSVDGLGLYRYERGFWIRVRAFRFTQAATEDGT